MSKDLDNDGILEEREIALFERKQRAQKNIAYSTTAALILSVALMMTKLIPIERVEALGGVMDAFFIGGFSLVGAFMGFSVWMDKKK